MIRTSGPDFIVLDVRLGFRSATKLAISNKIGKRRQNWRSATKLVICPTTVANRQLSLIANFVTDCQYCCWFLQNLKSTRVNSIHMKSLCRALQASEKKLFVYFIILLETLQFSTSCIKMLFSLKMDLYWPRFLYFRPFNKPDIK